jgi:hypothetical protein
VYTRMSTIGFDHGAGTDLWNPATVFLPPPCSRRDLAIDLAERLRLSNAPLSVVIGLGRPVWAWLEASEKG